MTIDVIIPTYKPDQSLFTLLDSLLGQSIPVQNIILMNTEEKYFAQLNYGRKCNESYRNVQVFHVSKKEFDHGRTRRMGVSRSKADIFVMMTQDALPADEYLLERLTANLSGQVAISYARQLPAQDCSVIERYTRQFNYPDKSHRQSAEQLGTKGIKTYFCSNVCAAYRRDIYDASQGFIRHTIFNEDMIYAAGIIKAGYEIAYEADAKVVHSHNYTCAQQLHRNFDLGVSQADHPEIFKNIPSEAEGSRMVKQTLNYLMQQGLWNKMPAFMLQCMSRYMGYLLGKNYRRLPRSWVLALTMNKEYWER